MIMIIMLCKLLSIPLLHIVNLKAKSIPFIDPASLGSFGLLPHLHQVHGTLLFYLQTELAANLRQRLADKDCAILPNEEDASYPQGTEAELLLLGRSIPSLPCVLENLWSRKTMLECPHEVSIP